MSARSCSQAQEALIRQMMSQGAPIEEIMQHMQLSRSEAYQHVRSVFVDFLRQYGPIAAAGDTELPMTVGWDSLTGALTRQAGEVKLLRFIQNAGNTWPLTIVFIDVDNLKAVNDQLGHNAGDRLLCVMVHDILSNIRRSDELIRWAGDEFILALPNTDFGTGAETMTRIRAADPSLKFSSGVAEWHPGESLDQLIERADSAMYKEKALHKAHQKFNPPWPGIHPERRNSQRQ